MNDFQKIEEAGKYISSLLDDIPEIKGYAYLRRLA
jgi:hypothetical protein